jgi:hypothetical protein
VPSAAAHPPPSEERSRRCTASHEIQPRSSQELGHYDHEQNEASNPDFGHVLQPNIGFSLLKGGLASAALRNQGLRAFTWRIPWIAVAVLLHLARRAALRVRPA